MPQTFRWMLCLLVLLVAIPGSGGEPVVEFDLATASTATDGVLRAYGSNGDGGLAGVPVAGGFDMDDDGLPDFAFASILSDPLGRLGAGEVYLLFGDGTVSGDWDTAGFSANILKFAGDVDNEAAGSEIWMDDVTGDGLGDLLIARQNFTPDAGRIGAGALSIVLGAAALRTEAANLQYVDLRSPPPSLTIATFVGAAQQDRLGIWMRTGDVTGDGIADIVVGADQVSDVATHAGVAYVIRGGPHLAADQTIDLADFGTGALPGHLARVRPPGSAAHRHFGATVQVADLDGNGRAEVLSASTLNRAGAAIQPAGASGNHSSGGTLDGTFYIAWDDNFPEPWVPAPDFALDSAPGTTTSIDGDGCHQSFGEEMLGGLDYDADGRADLFVGDIVGNCGPTSLPQAGAGMIFWGAEDLAGVSVDLNTNPTLARSEIYGAFGGDIAADTALHGDFDGDGIADLGIGSPHGNPQGRFNAGVLHVLLGRNGAWPAEVDLGALPLPEDLFVIEIQGANGGMGFDTGDTLTYSAAAGDIDLDGRIDLITNEMVGNGLLPEAEDAGNLIIVSGETIQALPEPTGPMVWGVALGALWLSARIRGRRAAR